MNEPYPMRGESIYNIHTYIYNVPLVGGGARYAHFRGATRSPNVATASLASLSLCDSDLSSGLWV